MHIHYFQHDEYEDLGCIAEWAANNGHSTSCTRFDLDMSPPPVTDFDALIVMGGHMGANDEDKFPWLIKEKRVISEAIRNNKIVIGICLGSQLVAAAMGAKVYKNPYPEIGVFPLQLASAAFHDPVFSHLKNGLEVLHWHFDTFDLPDGSVNMASSAATKHQAFRFGKNVYALQFHFEQSEKTIDRFISEGRFELLPGKWIQSEDEIRQYKSLCVKNNQIFFSMLDIIYGYAG